MCDLPCPRVGCAFAPSRSRLTRPCHRPARVLALALALPPSLSSALSLSHAHCGSRLPSPSLALAPSSAQRSWSWANFLLLPVFLLLPALSLFREYALSTGAPAQLQPLVSPLLFVTLSLINCFGTLGFTLGNVLVNNSDAALATRYDQRRLAVAQRARARLCAAGRRADRARLVAHATARRPVRRPRVHGPLRHPRKGWSFAPCRPGRANEQRRRPPRRTNRPRGGYAAACGTTRREPLSWRAAADKRRKFECN